MPSLHGESHYIWTNVSVARLLTAFTIGKQIVLDTSGILPDFALLLKERLVYNDVKHCHPLISAMHVQVPRSLKRNEMFLFLNVIYWGEH